LIIRLIGVYLIYLAVTNAISFIVAFMTVMQTPKLLTQSFGVLLQPIIWIVIYIVAGNYLIRDGQHLFTILNREDSPNSLEKDLQEAKKDFNSKQNT
jgi:beta-lactamase regulating signal transducer with metallopeptidase domain